MPFDADDAAIAALRRQPAAPQASLDLLELYVNTPGNTDVGAELRMQIITGKDVVVNGSKHKLTAHNAQELAAFISNQPADIRIALWGPLSHLQLASSVGQNDLVEILRDIDFVPIPPGIVQPKDNKTHARLKAYSWAFTQAIQEGDMKAATRLAHIMRIYIESGSSSVFPVSGGAGRIGHLIPDGTVGPIRAYARGFTANEGKGKDSKTAGLDWFDSYVAVSLHPNKQFIHQSLSQYANNGTGPITLATPAAIALKDQLRKEGAQAPTDNAKAMIRSLLKDLPDNAKNYRSGHEDKAAQTMRTIASGILNNVPQAPDRMTREELHLYGEALSKQIDRAGKVASGQLKQTHDHGQSLGGAMSQYILDQSAITPYIRDLADQDSVDRLNRLRSIGRPTNEYKKSNPFPK